MEIEKRTFKKASLEKLFDSLKSEGKKIIAPVKKGNIIDFCEISSLKEMAEDIYSQLNLLKVLLFQRLKSYSTMK